MFNSHLREQLLSWGLPQKEKKGRNGAFVIIFPENVQAVSGREFPTTDSNLFYDSKRLGKKYTQGLERRFSG